MIGSARAGQTITLMPVFGAVLAAALLGARMALIFAGTALSALGQCRAVSD